MFKRLQLTAIMVMVAITMLAQGQIKGNVLDKANSEALAFVSVALSPQGSEKVVAGATTDATGSFMFNNVKYGNYTMTFTFMGYKTVKRQVSLSQKNQHANFPAIHMSEDAQMLKEVQVTGQRSTMKLDVDRKSFDVAGMISNEGMSASEVLENIPSVEVDNDGNVSLRGNSSVEVWINGRASGLTSDNQAQILQQIPAESIERIEVIDNPSAKFSAEGSTGIINIVLKKDRKAGYYGSVQVGADTRGGANTSASFNYSSSKIDAYANVGYRHRENDGRNESEQDNFTNGEKSSYERHTTKSAGMGNNLFSRAGFTWHVDEKNDLGLSGMFMTGKNKNNSSTPYYYGNYQNGIEVPTRTQWRDTRSGGPMNMIMGEFNYRHSFSEKHFIDLIASTNSWKMDNESEYRDRMEYEDPMFPTTSSYMMRPLNVRNNRSEIKLQYENQVTDKFKIEAGYNADFSHEKTPQVSFYADNWDGTLNYREDYDNYNDFKYNKDTHALYTTLSYNFGKFTTMAGLRGEYWKVNTETWGKDQNGERVLNQQPFKKDYFELFPSLFVSYQMTKTQQLQLNYTRRLRRPWGGELNNFRNNSDASMVSFGNPQLTPEFSNSFSLNYLKSWDMHSLLVSAYYRPTTDVIQRINYRSTADNVMYSTPQNVAKSTSTGIEITAKNKLFTFLDLTTNVNAYYYKLNDFAFDIEGQTVTGEGRENFTWNARVIAAFKLPYDISIQASGRYNSRQAISQGHRPATYGLDLGVRKNFFNRLFTLAVNCRDVLDTRKWESFTESDSFSRHQINRRRSRTVNFTLTWNFGNGAGKKRKQMNQQDQDDDDAGSMGGYDM